MHVKSIEKPCLYTWERITSRQAVLILDETQIHEGEIQKEQRVLKKNSDLVWVCVTGKKYLSVTMSKTAPKVETEQQKRWIKYSTSGILYN